MALCVIRVLTFLIFLLPPQLAISESLIWTIVRIHPFHSADQNAHQILQVSKYFDTQDECEKNLIKNFVVAGTLKTFHPSTGLIHVVQYREANHKKFLYLEWQCILLTK
tara:strand:+ start:70 stop:396 length:327 start_codon:yes stop_codon:yes gene_type:complete